mmetsp:Transcript_16324/g.65954  ORF Transcript_16324/g.65954 Transcript_16324/m.65954 type:complete len:235 (+) Transcript_16324:350-1054(+)
MSPRRPSMTASSVGGTNLAQSCVPRGSRPRRSSAVKIARRYEATVRSSVDTTTEPPSRQSVASVATKASTSATCSTTSSAHTTSKPADGMTAIPSSEAVEAAADSVVDAVPKRRSSGAPTTKRGGAVEAERSASARLRAASIATSLASTPTTVAPYSAANPTESRPPPQPTSRTVVRGPIGAPVAATLSATYLRRMGFRACSGAAPPPPSSAAQSNVPNLATSAASTDDVAERL